MRTALILICLLCVQPARAQIPVIDVASIAKAVAQLAELREQVRLLSEALTVTRALRNVAQNHLGRYERALTKRGVVPTEPMETASADAEAAMDGTLSFLAPEELARLYRMYDIPTDPLAHDRAVTARSMHTVTGTVDGLAAHRQQILRAQDELDRFKEEITNNPEPQQMRDVQASLQVLTAREALLTRQTLMMLTNMEAVRAAQELNDRAQRRAVFELFVGQTDWLGDQSQYEFRSFLRMPGQ